MRNCNRKRISCCGFCMVFVAGIVVLLTYDILDLSKPTVYMEDAYVALFDLQAPSNWGGGSFNLTYNLTVVIRLRNGNPKHTLHYRGITARAYYQGNALHSVDSIHDFFQRSMDSTKIRLRYSGTRSLAMDPTAVGFSRKEKEADS